MPIRDHWKGFGGGDPSRRDRDSRSAPQRSGEGRSFVDEAGFRAEQARLEAALARQERERGRPRAPEYGHDQNYRPGYHEGGSRFGFFSLGETYGDRSGQAYGTRSDYAFNADIDQDFDPDYLHWRNQQLQRHDRDYADWRRHQREQYDEEYRRFRTERRDDFHQRFQDWRAQRDAEANASAAAAPAKAPDDKI